MSTDEPTVFDNYEANVVVDATIVNLNLWDTAGQESYDRLRPLSYPQTDAFLLCYNPTRPTTFDNLMSKWLPELAHHAPDVPILLVATKSDLLTDPETLARLQQRLAVPVTDIEAHQLSRDHAQIAGVVSCSAKTQLGVKNVMETAMRLILQRRMDQKRRTRQANTLLGRVKRLGGMLTPRFGLIRAS